MRCFEKTTNASELNTSSPLVIKLPYTVYRPHRTPKDVRLIFILRVGHAPPTAHLHRSENSRPHQISYVRRRERSSRTNGFSHAHDGWTPNDALHHRSLLRRA